MMMTMSAEKAIEASVERLQKENAAPVAANREIEPPNPLES